MENSVLRKSDRTSNPLVGLGRQSWTGRYQEKYMVYRTKKKDFCLAVPDEVAEKCSLMVQKRYEWVQ